jgi:hypothetical protein
LLTVYNVVFYYLDYDSATEEPRATVFRHRAVSEARRKLPKKLDLSLICDPLLQAAGVYTPDSPASPMNESRVAFDIPGKVPRSPVKSRAQSPTLADDEAEYDSYEEEEDEEEEPEDLTHLLLHTRVYALAEKYDIPALKELARRKFEMAMACDYDSPELPEAIEEVYDSTLDTDRGLRDIVLQLLASHPQLATTPDVHAVIKETPALAYDLFKVERGIPIAEIGR